MVSNMCEVVVSKCDLSPEGIRYGVPVRMKSIFRSDLDELAREVDELTRGASSEVDVPSCSDVASTPDEPVKDYASGWLDNMKRHHWRAPHGNVLLPVCLLH